MLNQNSILSSNTSGSGSGDGNVVGPASSTDNAAVRYNGTTGKLVQNSTVTIDDSGTVAATSVDATTTFTSTGAGTMFRAKRTGQNADFRIYQGVNNTILDNANGDQIDFAIGGTAKAFLSATGLNNAAIGATTPSTGAFTSVAVGTDAGFGGSLSQFNGSNAVIANTAGQFSIGTTDTAAADVGGSLGFTANTTTLAGYPMGSISARLVAAGAGAYESYMAFATTGAGGNVDERMRIDSSGNVGIGLTSPAYQIQLSTDSAAKPSTNTWTIASDARIKTETGEYTKGLDAVLSLRPVTYRYNGKAGMVDDGEDKISIIAQEAITAFPECVGSYTTKLEEDDEEETEVLNWNGHALTFALVNAVKELTARIAVLENS
jgi:trimeric autotransporter adhesin